MDKRFQEKCYSEGAQILEKTCMKSLDIMQAFLLPVRPDHVSLDLCKAFAIPDLCV